MRELTASAPTWFVYKNANSALYGTGDIDSAARPEDVGTITAITRAWARDNELLPLIHCHHFPSGRNFVAAPPDERLSWEVSVKQSKVFRGGTLFTVDGLLPMTEMSSLGFRALRPGAEGVLKLLSNGSRWGGRVNAAGLEAKHVRELLVQDPEGVAAAARMYGSAEGAVVRLAAAVSAGRWSWPASMTVELRQLGLAAAHPAATSRRARFRLVEERRCELIDLIHNRGRIVPEDRAAWLERIATTHAVDWGG